MQKEGTVKIKRSSVSLSAEPGSQALADLYAQDGIIFDPAIVASDEIQNFVNGTFQMMSTFGMLTGEFLSGLMADYMDKRMVLVVFAVIEFTAAWIFMYGRRKDVGKIYNRET